MTSVFRVENCRVSGPVLVGLMLVAVFPAAAQEGDAPLVLTPEKRTQSTDSDGNQRAGAPAGNLDFASPSTAEAVGRVGLPQETFGPNVWQNADWPVIEKLFRQMPTRSRSAVANSLLRRLLATDAEIDVPMVAERAPALSAAETDAGVAKSDQPRGAERLIFYRLNALLRRGHYDLVTTFARDMPEPADPEIARLETEALMLANDLNRACGHVRKWIERSADDFWSTAEAFCQMKAGKLSLAEATGEAKSRRAISNQAVADQTGVLKDLTDWTADKPKPVDSIKDLEPLSMAFLHNSNAKYNGKPELEAEPWHLRATAENPNIRQVVRIRAAEEAEHLGALSPAALRHLYRKLTEQDGSLKDRMNRDTVIKESGPRGRALLADLIASETQSAAAAELITRYLEASRFHGRPTQGMRVVYPYVKLLSIDPALVWFAPDAVRILVLHNDLEPARRWLALLRAEAARDSSLAELFERLGPLTWIGGLESPGRELQRALIQWHAMEKRRDPKGAADRAILAVTLLEALDTDIPTSLLQTLMNGAPVNNGGVPTPYLLALDKAAENQRVGETILLVMLTLGEGDLSATDPLALSHSVKALNTLGLVLEARALAVEAALVGGL